MANTPDTRTLHFLGRRVERLIFGGIFLVIVCFVETYLTTANRQLAEDRSTSTITALLNRLTSDEPHLTILFQSKIESPKSIASTLSKSLEKDSLVNETRKKLGLPPSATPKQSESLPIPRTYRETLDDIVSDLAKNPFVQQEELAKYADYTKSPLEIIQTLQKQRDILDKKPTSVWGIETPRLLQLQYAGLDYKFPFGFVSSMLAIALAPLIAGWLGALHVTRQRELMLVSNIDDYKLAFPHILNLLAVNFRVIEAISKKPVSIKSRATNRKINRISLSIIRTLIILLIALPMLLGFTYSMSQLWEVATDNFTFIFFVGVFMVIIMLLEIMILVFQEWALLNKKEFYE
jgi:hypothetical protein